MSFFSRLFKRKKDDKSTTVEVNDLVVEDGDLDYVYVYKNSGQKPKKQKNYEIYMEDPSEVDVSAWEMAKAWTRRDSESGGSHKRDRLAQKLDNIRHAPLSSGRARGPLHVVEYEDECMNESLQLQFDDKRHRQEKVENRRVKFNKHMT